MKWNKVYFSEQLYQAEIVKGVLEENGIKAVIVSKQDNAYHLGVHEVQVSSEEVIKALKIVNDDISFT